MYVKFFKCLLFSFVLMANSCEFSKKNNSVIAQKTISLNKSGDEDLGDRFADCFTRQIVSPSFFQKDKQINDNEILPGVLNEFRKQQVASYYQSLNQLEESSLSLLKKTDSGPRLRTFSEAFRDEITVSDEEKSKYLDEAVEKKHLSPAQRKKISQETVHQIILSRKREALLTQQKRAGQTEMIDVVIDRPCVAALPLQDLFESKDASVNYIHIFMDIFNHRHREDVSEILDKAEESSSLYLHFASSNIEGPNALAARMSFCARNLEKESGYRSLMREVMELPLELRGDSLSGNKFLNEKMSGKEQLTACVSKTDANTYARNLASILGSLYMDYRPEVFVKGVSYLWRSNRYNSIMEIQELNRL